MSFAMYKHLVVLVVLVVVCGCGQASIEQGSASLVNSGDESRSQSRHGAILRGETGQGADLDEVLRLIPDDVCAALVLEPRHLLKTPDVMKPLASLLVDFMPDLPVNPTRVEQVIVLATPFETSDVARLWGAQKTNDDASEDPKESAQETAAEASDAPDLDHLFQGLQPELRHDPVDDLAARTRKPVEQALNKFLIPPVAVIIRCSEFTTSSSLFSWVTNELSIDQRGFEETEYYRIQLSGSEYEDNPISIGFATDETIVLSRERFMRRILRSRMSDSPLVRQLRETLSDKPHAAAVVVLDPIRDAALELVSLASATAGDEFTEVLSAAVRSVDLCAVDINLSDSTVLTCQLDCPGADDATELGSLLSQPIEEFKTALADHNTQLQQNAPPGSWPLVSVVHDWFTSTTTQVVDRRVFVRADNVDSLRDPIQEAGPWLLETAERFRRHTNLRRIGRAMLEYCRVNGRLPDNSPFGISDYPVSWRVKLLPYLGEADTFDEYFYDEPWNSNSNQRAGRRMPRIYGSRRSSTSIVIFTGRGSPFEGEAIDLSDVSDGLGQTIFAVYAGNDQEVTWFEPRDLTVDNDDPLAPLGEIPAEGLDVVMFNGDVMTIPASIDAETFWRLVNHQDGKPVDATKLLNRQ